MKGTLTQYLNKNVPIYPLVTFRLVFGLIMLIATLRFFAKGWIREFYIDPDFHFTYYGFEWVRPLGEFGMYGLFSLMALSFFCISIGLFYRQAAVVAFLSFTYVELIDKTYYLNHYYFVSLVTFLLIFIPAHRYFSLDVFRKPELKTLAVPKWSIDSLKFQLGMVYFFAGLAKINSQWLLEAKPLIIWLKAYMDTPIFGNLLAQDWMAFAMSWAGTAYDLLIPFFLLSHRFRPLAFTVVIGFHALTAMLFPIGLFPYIMIGATLIFFSTEWHAKIWKRPTTRFSFHPSQNKPYFKRSKWVLIIFVPFFLFQLIMPLRHLVYPGNLFWTEQGYRFSWRVMLMEKAGYAIFQVFNKDNGQKWEARNYDFLSPAQEKMMATQPDMILQFAHLLKEKYREEGHENLSIKVWSYVSLNGAPGKLMIDPNIDLLTLSDGFKNKNWITSVKAGNK